MWSGLDGQLHILCACVLGVEIDHPISLVDERSSEQLLELIRIQNWFSSKNYVAKCSYR